MSELKIGIVEDEVVIAEQLRATLEHLGYNVVEPCGTYSEALEMLNTEDLDLVILDIQLGGNKTGLDVAEAINQKHKIPFIFLTSNSDRSTVEKAKHVRPGAFLVKPFNREDLFASIEIAIANKALETQSHQDSKVFSQSIFIKENHRFYKVAYKDIAFLKSDHVYIEVHTISGKKYVVRSSLSNFIEQITSTDFVQVHRSHWINLHHFESMNTHDVVVNGTSLPVGKVYRDQLMGRLNSI